MFARFDENPAMTLQDIKETKRYGRTHGRTHGRTDNVKTVYHPQTKFAGGITNGSLMKVKSIAECSMGHSAILLNCIKGDGNPDDYYFYMKDLNKP